MFDVVTYRGWFTVNIHTVLYFSLFCLFSGGARVAQWVWLLDLTAHTSLSPIQRGFAPSFVNYKKGCTRLAAKSDKVYQLLAQGWWFSPGTPTSSTTKTGRHDIAEILLKVALNPKKSIEKINVFWKWINNKGGSLCKKKNLFLTSTIIYDF